MFCAFSFDAYSEGETGNNSEGTSCFYKFKYGVEGGLTLFNQLNKYDGESNNDYMKSKAGFHLAGTALYNFTSAFFMIMMLDFALKGSVYDYSSESYSYKEKLNLFYLQIPFLFAYNLVAIQAYTISVLAGPYFAVALSGKWKWEDSYNGQTESGTEKVEFGKDNDFRRADYGAIFGVMVTRGLFSFRLAYQLGLKNIYPDGDKDNSLKNSGFNLSVGYRFNCGGQSAH